MIGFQVDVTTRNAVLCQECAVEWKDVEEEVARRWLRGLQFCFFCRRPLGLDRFPAQSPLGTSCAECGLALAALVAE